MLNTFKLIVYIRLQQISCCYRWIHVVLVTQCIRNNYKFKALYVTKLQLSDGVSERVNLPPSPITPSSRVKKNTLLKD